MISRNSDLREYCVRITFGKWHSFFLYFVVLMFYFINIVQQLFITEIFDEVVREGRVVDYEKLVKSAKKKVRTGAKKNRKVF